MTRKAMAPVGNPIATVATTPVPTVPTTKLLLHALHVRDAAEDRHEQRDDERGDGLAVAPRHEGRAVCERLEVDGNDARGQKDEGGVAHVVHDPALLGPCELLLCHVGDPFCGPSPLHRRGNSRRTYEMFSKGCRKRYVRRRMGHERRGAPMRAQVMRAMRRRRAQRCVRCVRGACEASRCCGSRGGEAAHLRYLSTRPHGASALRAPFQKEMTDACNFDA